MADELFAFSDLIARVAPEFNSHGRWKVVRHLDTSADVDLVALFHTGREAIEEYQRWQGSDIFAPCDGFFSFLGLPGKRAQFMAAYQVLGPGTLALLPDGHDPAIPAALRPMFGRWKAAEAGVAKNYRYDLKRDERFTALEMRPVIAWGEGTRKWHQWSLDKPVLELRQPDQIRACPAFAEVEVTLAELKFLAGRQEANPSWPSRLGSVGGIYLLTDEANDKVYVGQAGAEQGGFWARWVQYALGQTTNEHPAFRPDGLPMGRTKLSILEVVPLGVATKSRLDRLENRWKERLRSRCTPHSYNLG